MFIVKYSSVTFKSSGECPRSFYLSLSRVIGKKLDELRIGEGNFGGKCYFEMARKGIARTNKPEKPFKPKARELS